MITRTELNEKIREWGIREDVIEKDYVIGWTLWGIGSNPQLSNSWAFKGGTCLKKCYIETYRFSEGPGLHGATRRSIGRQAG